MVKRSKVKRTQNVMEPVYNWEGGTALCNRRPVCDREGELEMLSIKRSKENKNLWVGGELENRSIKTYTLYFTM